MNTLYIITGPAGVGKSTISKMIADSAQKSALIEGDDIYHQVISGYVPAWKEGNHLDVFWEICLNNIESYLKKGYDTIFNYIINPQNLQKIKDRFSGYNIKFVVLLVDEETILKRDSLRPENCQMKERCLILLNNFKNNGYSEANILDTSHLNQNETLDIILKEDRFIL